MGIPTAPGPTHYSGPDYLNHRRILQCAILGTNVQAVNFILPDAGRMRRALKEQQNQTHMPMAHLCLTGVTVLPWPSTVNVGQPHRMLIDGRRKVTKLSIYKNSFPVLLFLDRWCSVTGGCVICRWKISLSSFTSWASRKLSISKRSLQTFRRFTWFWFALTKLSWISWTRCH